MTLHCVHCNLDSTIDTARLTIAGSHIKASCPRCGKYIKFIPRDQVPRKLVIETVFKPKYQTETTNQDAPF